MSAALAIAPADPAQGDAALAARLRERHARFAALLELAEARCAAGDGAAAAALAQVAARSAFPDHPGQFGSPRLERLLLQVGRGIPAPAASALPRERGRRDVLHVLTYARPVGGDGRFVWRWMLADRESRHSVVITTQSHYKGVFEIPAYLREAAEASGGRLHAIRASASKPIEQARELRAWCQGRDLVVLHLWPYDVVPILALAAGCDEARTLFVNHSDHTVWLGAGVAHSIVHLRTQEASFLRERRGLAPERSSILPIPLARREARVSRAEAKRALGHPPDGVLLLTIGSEFKYSAPGQSGFLDLVVPILEKAPDASLVAIGPRPEGAWRAARERTHGRIEPLGARWDNELLLAAADLYLDAIPFSSITSLLEAGSQGLPILGLAPADPGLALLGPGAPGLDGAIELAPDAASYQRTLAALIADPERRRALGRRIEDQILALHTGAGWLERLRALYASTNDLGPRGCLAAGGDAFATTPLDLAVARLYEHAYEPGHVARLIRNYVGALRYGSRLSVSRDLRRAGFDVSPLQLLPPPLNGVVRSLGRNANRLREQLAMAWKRRA
jgi:hypothetical protein